MHTGIGLGIPLRSSAGGGGAPAQTTSVNSNNSLTLTRSSNLPTGAYTVTLWAKFSTLAEALQNVIRSSCALGYWQVYGEVQVVKGLSGSGSGTLSPAAYDGWGFVAVHWAGSPADPVLIGYTPDGGARVEVTGDDQGAVAELFVTGIHWIPGAQPDQLYTATIIVWDGDLTLAEEVAQMSSPTPVATDGVGGSGATVNSWSRMVSGATAGQDESGNGNHWAVTGTGVTVTDSPY